MLFLTRYAINTGWWYIEIHSCDSLVKIFAPICTWENNRRIWCHNASALRFRDITDQLWWRHNVKSEKTVLNNNGEMFVCCGMVYSRHKIACKKWNNTFVTANNDVLVTLEVICRWFSLKSLAIHLTSDQKSLFTVTHALFFISWQQVVHCYISMYMHCCWKKCMFWLWFHWSFFLRGYNV